MTTTEPTPTDPTARAPRPPPLPPTARYGRYDRFRGEVMAGGSVTEASDRAVRGRPGRAPSPALGIIGLLVWLAVDNHWMFLFVVGILVSVFLHETGHFVTARLTGMKATQFFIGLRAAAVELPSRRDRVRRAAAARSAPSCASSG